MDDHHQSPNADVIGTVGETDQKNSCCMMDDLLIKVLMKKNYSTPERLKCQTRLQSLSEQILLWARKRNC